MDDRDLRTMAVKLALEGTRGSTVGITAEALIKEAKTIHEFLTEDEDKKDDVLGKPLQKMGQE